MGDTGFWHILFSPATPLYIVAAAVIGLAIRAGPSFMAGWNERQRDKVAERGSDWSRLREEIARYAAEVKLSRAEFIADIRDLKAREIQCQQDLTDAVKRIAALEGYNDGRAKSAQDAAGIVAIERLTDAAERKEGEAQ